MKWAKINSIDVITAIRSRIWNVIIGDYLLLLLYWEPAQNKNKRIHDLFSILLTCYDPLGWRLGVCELSKNHSLIIEWF